MLVVSFVLFIILLFLYSAWKRRKWVKIFDQIGSGLHALPLIGHSYMFFGGDENRMRALQTVGRDAIHRGGITACWHCNRFFVFVADPNIAEILLKTCLEKDDIMKASQLLTDNGSIFAPVAIWRPRRKVLTPNFSTKVLKNFVTVFSEQSEVLVNQLKRVVGSGTVSVWNFFTTYTMDTVCETSLGVQVKSQINPNLPFLKAFEECCNFSATWMVQPWLHNMTIYKMLPQYKRYMRVKHFVCDFVKEIVLSKRKLCNHQKNENEENTKNPNGITSLVDLLIQNSNFSDTELREEAMVMVLAGTDTAAVAASFAAVMLSKHLDVQQKVYEELREVFGDSDRPVEAEDLPRLRYLDAVIRETLRLYPPVPVITRKVTKDVTLPNGITLTPGSAVLVNIWAIHRNPKYWGDNAEEFLPERFLDTALKHPAAFMPFSCAPRGCIGYQYSLMTLKTALAFVVRKYRLLPANDNCKSDRHAPLRLKFNIMMKDVNNFKLRIESRK